LLRLLRGAGVRGLTAIHEFAPLRRGFLARPFLWATRAEITAQALRWKVTWIEDPANREQRFDRNFLRERVVPVLLERWPAAPRLAAGLAHRMREAEQLLEELARQDAAGFDDPGRVPCSTLRGLGAPRLNNLLRHLLRRLDLPMASAVHLDRLRTAIAADGDTSLALVGWPGVEARLHRDHLYLMRTLAAAEAPVAARLTLAHEWRSDHGRLRVVQTADAGFPEAWVRDGLEVRFRTGGERFTPPRRTHTKSLKQWFQEAGIVPWMRDRIPLLYRDGALIGIADFLISEEARVAASSGPRWRASWTDHPPVY
jgi:tRNA(Ile)-lysidine synthase